MSLTSVYRTHTCGQLRAGDAGSSATLSGWLHNRRDHGGVLFLDLRDNYGLTQVVVRPDSPLFEPLSSLPKESVVRISGQVVPRAGGNVNPELATGEIELIAGELEVLGECDQLPFQVAGLEKTSEDLRLTYRFLDLRREGLHRNVLLRSAIISRLRELMNAQGFTEFQTPILSAPSPEGARDFLVPSRLHPGSFYALPQAPQQFKQLLMMSGFDRYFQIAPCFRDEDSRADRSPGEFYQLDVEMSFVEQDDVFVVIEQVMTQLFTQFANGRAVSSPFPRIPFREALLAYGSDKPDLRSPLKMLDVTTIFADTQFRAFAGKQVRALPVPGCQDQPRKFFDAMEALAKEQGAGGLAWVKVGEDGQSVTGSVAKFLSEAESEQLIAATKAEPGTGIFLGAGEPEQVGTWMAPVRIEAAKRTGVFEENVFRFCWVVDFPMYERDDDGKIGFSHNPFSMPQGGMEALTSKDPLEILAWQYDIVCNGIELSSGAIRNHRPDIMLKAFEIAGYSAAEVEQRFGGMLRALRFGAPPHGGIAPGVDRIAMLLAEVPNIREVIAFPLNQQAQDLLMGAPAPATEQHLRELHLQLKLPAAK